MRQACGRPCPQKKNERRGKKGGPIQGMRRESQELTGCWEKEKRTVHKDGECGMMLRPCENGEQGPDTDSIHGAHNE